jgi:hypothetical protein
VGAVQNLAISRLYNLEKRKRRQAFGAGVGTIINQNLKQLTLLQQFVTDIADEVIDDSYLTSEVDS